MVFLEKFKQILKFDMKFLNRFSIAAVLLTACQIASADVGTKSAEMLDKDPHGWIMTVTSVCVVFAVLIILWFIYAIVGKLFAKGFNSLKPGSSKAGMSPETAAAIAMALEKESNSEADAAIALALHLYMNDTVHDNESFVLTIKPTFGPYASRQFTLRQMPERKK